MKKIIALSLALAGILGSCRAQDVQLPAPDMNQKSMTVVEALATRHSVREYSERQLTAQELSNLLWAACGMTRDTEHRTAPTAMNRKEVRLYAFTDSQVYEYKAVENVLKSIAQGDHRKLVAGGKSFSQAFVETAPVVLVMVIDYDLFGSNGEKALMMGCVDAGNISQNINLYCQSVGMATVPRATMDVDGLRQLLGLTENQLPIMNNPVGFLK